MKANRDVPSLRSEVLGVADEVEERAVEPRAIAEHPRSGTARDL
jgi:hypothetical protein